MSAWSCTSSDREHIDQFIPPVFYGKGDRTIGRILQDLGGKKMMVNIMMITAAAEPAIQQIVKETSDNMEQKMKTGKNKK